MPTCGLDRQRGVPARLLSEMNWMKWLNSQGEMHTWENNNVAYFDTFDARVMLYVFCLSNSCIILMILKCIICKPRVCSGFFFHKNDLLIWNRDREVEKEMRERDLSSTVYSSNVPAESGPGWSLKPGITSKSPNRAAETQDLVHLLLLSQALLARICI